MRPSVRPVSHIGGRRVGRAALGLLATIGLLAAPVGGLLRPHTAARAAGDPNTLIMVNGNAPADIDPASDQQAAGNMIQRNIYDQLFAFKGSSLSVLEPMLASGYKANADNTVFTVSLRRGATFHSGREVTADDVKYSIARCQLAGLASSYLFARFMKDPLKQIVVKDKYTIEFRMTGRQPLFMLSLANEYAAAIMDATELQKHVVKKDFGHAWATDHDLGSGPYTLGTWQRGQQVTLNKFAGYWRGWSGKHFSTVLVRYVPESTTRREQVERGTADLTFGLTPDDNDALAKNSAVKVSANFTTALQYMTMTQGGALAKPEARQALSYAFNYDAYIQAAYHNKYARRAYGPIPSVLLGFDKSVFKYQTDLNKAKELFAKAGLGQGSSLTLTVTNAPEYAIAAQILTAQLAQIGITLKVTTMDEAAYTAIYYKTEPADKHPNLLVYTWWPDFNDPYDMALPLIYSKSAGAAGANAGYYNNPTVDKLMDASANADRPTLIRNFKQIQDIVSRQNPPSIWLSEPAQVTVMRSDVGGLVFNPLEIQTYYFYALHR